MAEDKDDIFERIAGEVELTEPGSAPSRLKARIYSALMQQESASGPLMSVTECKAAGQELCIFEEIARVAPMGESVKSLNFCRVCHARVLAENLENPPIFWPGCPYVQLKKSVKLEPIHDSPKILKVLQVVCSGRRQLRAYGIATQGLAEGISKIPTIFQLYIEPNGNVQHCVVRAEVLRRQYRVTYDSVDTLL